MVVGRCLRHQDTNEYKSVKTSLHGVCAKKYNLGIVVGLLIIRQNAAHSNSYCLSSPKQCRGSCFHIQGQTKTYVSYK